MSTNIFTNAFKFNSEVGVITDHVDRKIRISYKCFLPLIVISCKCVTYDV